MEIKNLQKENCTKKCVPLLSTRPIKILSKGSVILITDGYNKTADSSGWKVEDSCFRLMLGYYWSIGNQPAFAFGEADVLSEKSGTKDLTYLA